MHVSRTGSWLSFNPAPDSPTDLEFLESLGAVYVDKAKVYRMKYSEPSFNRIVEYAKVCECSMDASCVALATFSYAWMDKLAETVVEESLRPQMKHQKQGVTFLLEHKRAGLAFDMGTGKSKTAIDTFTYLEIRQLADICLVVTDATVVDTWVTTLVSEDSTYQAIALVGSRTDRITRLRWGLAQGYKFFVINYEGVEVIEDELRGALNERTVLVLDESQRVKNHTTNRFKTLWKLFEKCQFTYIFLLSGTPITQSPEDAFGQCAFIDTSLFGHPRTGYYGFKATYVQTSQYDKHVVIGYRNMQKFLEKFHSRWFRVKTSDVADLPPKEFIPVQLDLPPQLQKVYKEYVKSKGFVRVPGHPRQGDRDELYVSSHPFTVLSKAIQIVNNFIYLTTQDDDLDIKPTRDIIELFEDLASPKMNFCLQLLEDTDQQVIFTYKHYAMRKIIERSLLSKRHDFVTVDGDVPVTKRPDVLRQFTSGQKRILVAQERTIRTGISLVNSRIFVHLERDFSVDTRQQLEKRIHRLGMDMGIKNVLYYDLMYKDTAEVTVYDQLMKGVDLSAALVDLNNIELMLTGAWDTK